jgi:putative selenate reductase molybdopterin-binding subunit
MKIELRVNGSDHVINAESNLNLRDALRNLGFLSVKSGGCRLGECGACAVLLDGMPVNSCMLLAVQAEGHELITVESIGEVKDQGWKKTAGLDIIQEAFIETGAVQCGYCTPAMILAAKSLLEHNANPSEAEVREVLSGVLCRCTAYVKPVEAVLLAAKWMHGGRDESFKLNKLIRPKMVEIDKLPHFLKVNHSELKLDAVKLVQGKPAFTADMQIPGTLFAKVLRSPYAHAEIEEIDTSKAKALPGVAAVLTWKDIPRVIYSSAGQSDPIPGPLDMFSLDHRVRFVGDRVAFLSAQTPDISAKSVGL